jgi:nickel-dependent lactate racemase
MQVTIHYGRDQLTLSVPEDRLVPVERPATSAPVVDPVRAVREALEAPLRFPPLRQALTPDDHVTVVVDERLPGLPGLLTAVLEHIASAGVAPEAITVLCPPSTFHHDWALGLPAEFRSVQVASHAAGDRVQLAYLASTRRGRRVYLNRSVVDADQLVVLSSLRYDSLLGHAGGTGAVFPTLSDGPTRHAWDRSLTLDPPAERPWPALGEADEVAWLLGAPFLIQVVEGAGDDVGGVIAGTTDAAADGRALLDRTWRGTVARRADTVIAAISGDPARQDVGDMARALACAARVVRPDGHIVLLCQTDPELGEGFRRMAREEDPEAAAKVLRKEAPDDWPDVYPWLQAARTARLMVLSGLPPETAEGLFATPLEQGRQVQRLIDAGGDCVVLPDAHKLLVTAAGD